MENATSTVLGMGFDCMNDLDGITVAGEEREREGVSHCCCFLSPQGLKRLFGNNMRLMKHFLE